MTSLFGFEGKFPVGIWVRIVAGAMVVSCVAILFGFGGSHDFPGILEGPAGGALVGLAAFAGALLLAGAIAELRDDRYTEKIREGRRSRLGEPVKIRVAQIASDLVPLIDELPQEARKNGVLRIVGYDGSYIRSRYGNVWESALRRWLREGLAIEYILMRPGPEVESAYRNFLSRENEETRSRMNILCVRENFSKKDFENAGIDRESLERKHPTLFYGDIRGPENGESKIVKAMWIEGIHDPGCNVAYDVTYISPEAMGNEEEKRYDYYDRELQSLKEFCESRPCA